jgi:hypothetical protein
MMKLMVAAAAAAVLCAPDAAAQNIVQKTDWSAKSFESYLPPPARSVPWLDLDFRTGLPRQDMPIGWRAEAPTSFGLRATSPGAWAASGATNVRRM